MSAQTTAGLDAWANVPEPGETSGEWLATRDIPDTEQCKLDGFDTPRTLTAAERIRKAYLVAGFDVDRAADSLGLDVSDVLQELVHHRNLHVSRLSEDRLETVWEFCDGSAGVVECATEDESVVYGALARVGLVDPRDVPARVLSAWYDDAREDHMVLAQRLDASVKATLLGLVDAGRVELHEPYVVRRLNPEELGLSPCRNGSGGDADE